DHLRKAPEWDPYAPGLHDPLGIFLTEMGRPAEAAAALWRAAQLSPADPQAAFNAALAFAGARRLNDAELALRETLKRNASFDRAWYNLGLLLAQTGRGAESVQALETAERTAPAVADYPYARATILWQQGDRAGARAAAEKALRANPAHPGARHLLESR
ncbi:MAG: tetratricopeptide repeat protein, partial [Opitutaceae bacterium]